VLCDRKIDKWVQDATAAIHQLKRQILIYSLVCRRDCLGEDH